MRYKKKFIIVPIILIIAGVLLFVAYKMSVYNVEGWSAIERKEEIDERFFLFVKNNDNIIRLECEPEQYKEIIIDSHIMYHISYTYSTYTPAKGNLIFIILDEPFFTG